MPNDLYTLFPSFKKIRLEKSSNDDRNTQGNQVDIYIGDFLFECTLQPAETICGFAARVMEKLASMFPNYDFQIRSMAYAKAEIALKGE